MKTFNKKTMDSFAKPTDTTAFENAYSYIFQTLNEILTNIKYRNPYINKYEVLVANEVFSGAEIPSSKLDLFLVIDAIQIELNSNQKKNRFLKGLKLFFNNFKENLIIFRSKKKKAEKLSKSTRKLIQNLDNYNVELLYKDIWIQLANYFSSTTMITLKDNSINISGKEDLGIDINIYPVFITENENVYKLYNVSNKKSIIIDFKDRYINTENKNQSTKNGYLTQTRIFNNLFYNYFKYQPNQIFIESLIYSCPNDLFEKDNILTTINLINYLKNQPINKIKSICDLNISLFDEILNTVGMDKALKFVREIKIDNFD